MLICRKTMHWLENEHLHPQTLRLFEQEVQLNKKPKSISLLKVYQRTNMRLAELSLLP